MTNALALDVIRCLINDVRGQKIAPATAINCIETVLNSTIKEKTDDQQ